VTYGAAKKRRGRSLTSGVGCYVRSIVGDGMPQVQPSGGRRA